MYTKTKDLFKEAIDKIEELIRDGNLRRIIIRDQKGDVFIEIPVIIGAITIIAAPYVSAIGAIAGYAAKFSIEMIKKDNSKILLLCESNPNE